MAPCDNQAVAGRSKDGSGAVSKQQWKAIQEEKKNKQNAARREARAAAKAQAMGQEEQQLLQQWDRLKQAQRNPGHSISASIFYMQHMCDN